MLKYGYIHLCAWALSLLKHYILHKPKCDWFSLRPWNTWWCVCSTNVLPPPPPYPHRGWYLNARAVKSVCVAHRNPSAVKWLVAIGNRHIYVLFFGAQGPNYFTCIIRLRGACTPCKLGADVLAVWYAFAIKALFLFNVFVLFGGRYQGKELTHFTFLANVSLLSLELKSSWKKSANKNITCCP